MIRVSDDRLDELIGTSGKHDDYFAALCELKERRAAQPAASEPAAWRCPIMKDSSVYKFSPTKLLGYEPLYAAPPAQNEDAARLNYLIASECQVWEVNLRYSIHAVTEHHPITAEYGTPREAIDAARQGKGEK